MTPKGAPTTHIVLLRGINVGGKARIAMPALRELAQQIGFTDVATYVQSGNLVLDSPLEPAAVADAIGFALQQATGLDIGIVTRTAAEWRKVIAANPFPEAAADGKTLHVTFLSEPAGAVDVDSAAFATEAFQVVGREVYMFLPGGIGRSKLAAALERAASRDVVATTRNWNTVLALGELVEGRGPRRS